MSGFFRQRSIFHSAMKVVTEQQMLWISPSSKPKDSNRAKGLPFISFVIHPDLEDQTEYIYNIENSAIRRQLEQLKVGEWYQVAASGDGEGAELYIEDASGAEIPVPPAPEPEQRTLPTSAPAARGQTAPAGAPQTRKRPSLSRIYWHAMEAATAMEEKYKERYGKEPSEFVRVVSSSFFIEFHKSGGGVAFMEPRAEGQEAQDPAAEPTPAAQAEVTKEEEPKSRTSKAKRGGKADLKNEDPNPDNQEEGPPES